MFQYSSVDVEAGGKRDRKNGYYITKKYRSCPPCKKYRYCDYYGDDSNLFYYDNCNDDDTNNNNNNNNDDDDNGDDDDGEDDNNDDDSAKKKTKKKKEKKGSKFLRKLFKKDRKDKKNKKGKKSKSKSKNKLSRNEPDNDNSDDGSNDDSCGNGQTITIEKGPAIIQTIILDKDLYPKYISGYYNDCNPFQKVVVKDGDCSKYLPYYTTASNYEPQNINVVKEPCCKQNSFGICDPYCCS